MAAEAHTDQENFFAFRLFMDGPAKSALASILDNYGLRPEDVVRATISRDICHLGEFVHQLRVRVAPPAPPPTTEAP